MYLCYLDESGAPERTDKSRHFVLLGLAIPAERWHEADARIEQIKKRYALDNAEIHTAYLIHQYPEQEKIADFEKLDYVARRLAVQVERQKALALAQHGKVATKLGQLKKDYRLTADYVHLSRKERVKFLCEIAQEIGKFQFARIFCEAVKKDRLPNHKDPFDWAFDQVVSRFHVFLKKTGGGLEKQHGAAVSRAMNCGLLIQDNNEARAKRLTKLMRSFHAEGTAWWSTVDRIIETPLFVESHLTSMVQLADLCAYAVRRYVEHGETDLFKRISPRFDANWGVLVGIRHYTGGERCTCMICKNHQKKPRHLTKSVSK